MASRRLVTSFVRQAAVAGPVGRSAVAGPSRWASSSPTRQQVAQQPASAPQDDAMTFKSSQASRRTESESDVQAALQDLTRRSGSADGEVRNHSQPSVLEETKVHARTHNHHVASLHLRSYGLPMNKSNLIFFTDFAMRAGYALGIPLSRPAALPVRSSLWTVLKGPFVHKKAQENFERRIHKRVIKAYDADPQVVERWLHFLRIHAMPGVGMRVETYRQLPLGIGAHMLEASTAALRSVPQGGSDGDKGSEAEAATAALTTRGSEGSEDTVGRLAAEFVRDEMAAYDKETRDAAASSNETPVVEQGPAGATENEAQAASADAVETPASTQQESSAAATSDKGTADDGKKE